jgi:hypothetical protein
MYQTILQCIISFTCAAEFLFNFHALDENSMTKKDTEFVIEASNMEDLGSISL